MKKRILVLEGDGIGPEIVLSSVRVLERVGAVFGHSFGFEYKKIGGAAIDEFGVPLPCDTLKAAKAADAVLLGAVGGYKWDTIEPSLRPEQGLLKIRKELGLFANIRPTRLFTTLIDACPLKNNLIQNGIDIIIVRELTGGVYFGEHKTKVLENGEKIASDLMVYSEGEVERIARVAFEIALKKDCRLVSVDKANVLDSSKLWREVVNRVSKSYKTVTLEHMYVDNAAMQIIKNPCAFSVMLTENMFGDILSDAASTLAGSLGMMPSASLRGDNFGLYEPIHGSAPDIASMDIANPIGTILSVALMLRYSFSLYKEATAIENAVEKTLKQGYRTKDLGGNVKCSEITKAIVNNIA